MSFFTSLTGLRAANTELSVTSNNIANVGTTGFKKSKASFGDIFASSPLQNSAGTVGQGVALKGIRQEFSQGSIEFSSNTLDLAISGDGFFPLKSADGQTDIFSRSGAFVLNEQGNVVNGSGQALMVSAVDGVGNAVGDILDTLTIPPATIGDAKETSLIELNLNLPADAPVIDAPFDQNDATTYNKSTAIDVYDAGGTAYSATVYYVKTSNPEANGQGGSTYNDMVNQPSSKWQTYVVIDGQVLEPKLQQAENDAGEALYVNQYGELKPFSEVAGEIQPGKTPKFIFDDLSAVQESTPASLEGAATPNPLGLGQGFNFFQDLAAAEAVFTPAQLTAFAQIDIDGSGNPVTLDLSALAVEDREYTGVELAASMQTQLNDKFGDDRFFDLSAPANREFVINHTQGLVETPINIDLGIAFNTPELQLGATTDGVVAAIQAQIDGALGAGVVTVTYDDVARNFAYQATNPADAITLQSGANGDNVLFGLGAFATAIDAAGIDASGAVVIPNGDFQRPEADQRFGMTVRYNNATETFSFASGTTGDASEIVINFDVGAADAPNLNEVAANFLGFAATEAQPELAVGVSDVALRGLESTPATAYGAPLGINIDNVFAVTANNNRFNVTVDGVSGFIEMPLSANYTMDAFTTELERQINALASADGAEVSGLTVSYDATTNGLVFTSGTTGKNSFVKVSGDAIWGLANTESARGETSTWIQPVQATELVDGVPVNQFIDQFGEETEDPAGFDGLPAWSPIYLDKGELTFNSAGQLVSPRNGIAMETAFLADGQGALDLTIDFAMTTQYNQSFALKGQSQDGAGEGNLVGLDVGDDGLIVASYSNGSQASLGKILLANFPSTEGLNQRGDSSFLSTANSGAATFGEPGSANFGSIRAGALEGSNVDLTAELVALITAQRNFQANAKAIETSSTLTSTILNI